MQGAPLSLLLVEDSSMDAELTLLSLERSGLQVQSRLVFDHVGVEHALREDSYDLILCDCVLPGSSGTDVLAIVQRLAPDIPFIFLSGIYGEEHAVEMIRLGATDYVLKKNLPLLPKAVRRALILCGNNVTEAARHLGISRLTLYRVLERSAPPVPPEVQTS